MWSWSTLVGWRCWWPAMALGWKTFRCHPILSSKTANMEGLGWNPNQNTPSRHCDLVLLVNQKIHFRSPPPLALQALQAPHFGEVALEASNVGARADWLWRAAVPMLGGISIRPNGYGRKESAKFTAAAVSCHPQPAWASQKGQRIAVSEISKHFASYTFSANYEGSQGNQGKKGTLLL